MNCCLWCGQVFMAHVVHAAVIYHQPAHHGISFSKWYTAIQRQTLTHAIFLSNRGRVTAERTLGCY